MGREQLGELELRVLLAVMHRRGDAYAVTIADEMTRRTGREPSRGALYVTLTRLTEKGLLTSAVTSSPSAPDDRKRRYYTPTPEGIAAAGEARRTMRSMWAGLEGELEGT